MINRKLKEEKDDEFRKERQMLKQGKKQDEVRKRRISKKRKKIIN